MDCSKFNIDPNALFSQIVPYFYNEIPETGIEREKFVAYMEGISSALANSFTNMLAECQSLKSFLSYTGFHMSLEYLLNVTYDPSLSRIRIIENNSVGFVGETWYINGETDQENKVWYSNEETISDNQVWYSQSDDISEFSFTIEIPSDVSFTETNLRALLANYVEASRTYNIILI